MKKFRDYSPPLQYGAKVILDDLEDAGVHTFGNVYWVDSDNGSDLNDGSTKSLPFATIPAAVSAAKTNNHDVIFLSGNAAHAQTSMLSITKNRLHFVGLSMRAGSFGYGARSRITMGDSTNSADIALMQNTGVGNTFTNVKFDSSSTVAASIWGVAEGGEYAIYRSCEFFKSTDLDQTLSAELLHNGDSTQYLSCTFGSLANPIVGAIIRPCVELARETITGKFSRDTLFDSCLFWRWAGDTANAFVDATGVTDVGRMLMFRDCDFIAAEKSTAIPAEAVTSSGGKQTDGLIMLKNSSAWNITLMKEASVGIWVSGPRIEAHAEVGVALEA